MSDTTERKPDDFDWVNARANCSPAFVFEKLRLLIENDVELRNRLRAKDTPFFKVVSGANRSRFSVVSESISVHQTVVFSLTNSEISATGINGPIFNATVTLSNDGTCRAKISQKEYDLWQLRKMALEDLFFTSHQEI